MVLLASCLLTAVVGTRWYVSVLGRTFMRLRSGLATRLLLLALPIALLSALYLTLMKGAAREVREHGEYIALFLALGGSWLIGFAWALAWLGIHVRDDALERNNAAAAVAASGALSGGMIVYGGANLGEGATIWMTIGPALLASVSISSLWGVHQALSGATDSIVIERDLASGIRFAGMTLGTGLIVGCAVAGDYVSDSETVRGLFVQSWPAVPLVALSILIQVKLRPTRAQPKPNAVTRGVLPALVYLVLAVGAIVWLGPFQIGAKQ
jgi:uncharacterized membrane protein YjfL (UPF0719 family)